MRNARTAKVLFLLVLAGGASALAYRYSGMALTGVPVASATNPYAGERRVPGVMIEKDRKLYKEIRRAGVRKDKAKLRLAADALGHPDYRVKRAAALSLGRMGSEDALPFLAEAERVEQHYAEQHYEHETSVTPAIKVAMARIKAGRAKGLSKINVFASELGTTTWGLAYQSRRNRPQVADRPVGLIDLAVQAASEMLAELKSEGYKVDKLADDFAFDKAQKMAIELAGLPERTQVEKLIDYICSLRSVTAEDRTIGQLLADHGEIAVQAAVKRLRDALQDSKRRSTGYGLLVRLLGHTGDQSHLPLLQELAARSENLDIRHEARMSARWLKSGPPVPKLGDVE